MYYCERAGDSFWSEPVNALTNLAFVLAALAVTGALRRAGTGLRAGWDLWLLAALMVAVGIGSFLWHTLATPCSELADILPILLFINVYLLSFLVRAARLGAPAVLAWFGLYHAANFGLQSALPRDFLNGSVFYLPTWASLLLMAAYAWHHDRPGRIPLAAGTLAFTVSLVLRTLDNALCPLWPLGTHWGWHLLNGLTLYLITTALLAESGTPHRSQTPVVPSG